MTAGEIKVLRINTRYVLAGVVGMALDINRPDGSVVNINAGITVGTVNVTSETGETLNANEYVLYTTTALDFPADGEYYLKLHVDFGASKKLKSFSKNLTVQA